MLSRGYKTSGINQTQYQEYDEKFGVVLIDSGKEVGDEAIPHGVGTTVKIREIVPTSNNRILLTGYGDKRFQITTTLTHKPYPQANVSFDLPNDSEQNKSLNTIPWYKRRPIPGQANTTSTKIPRVIRMAI